LPPLPPLLTSPLPHQKQNDAPYYLEMVLDGANKPLNWAYEPLNGFKLLFSPFFFDISYFATTFYVLKEESHMLQIVKQKNKNIGFNIQFSSFFIIYVLYSNENST
jgi:hypothetical protein